MRTTMRADALRNEAEFLPAELGDLVELRRRIVEAGHPQATASGIVGWLVAKAAGDIDPTSGPTRSRYRKILAELGDGEGPGGRGRAVPVGAGRGPRGSAQNPRSVRSVNQVPAWAFATAA